MKIKEIEERTGINASTLRYYEEEGLISPSRNSENSYREYSESDLDILFRIKFLRKLQMPVKLIAAVINETIDYKDAIKQTLDVLNEERENIDLSIELLEILLEENEDNSNQYVNRVFNFYKPHPIIRLFDCFSDYLSRHLPVLRMGFLPEEDIYSNEDLIFELIQYAKREDKKIEIHDNSTMPVVSVNDVKMQAILVPSNVGLNYRIVKFKVLKLK